MLEVYKVPSGRVEPHLTNPLPSKVRRAITLLRTRNHELAIERMASRGTTYMQTMPNARI